jgi:hypothetical protein
MRGDRVNTVVYPPPSGIGRTRTVGVIAHLMTDEEADAIVDQFAAQGIPVDMTHGPGYRVKLRPLAPVTTAQEVRAIRIVRELTDAPLIWDGPRRPVEPKCLLCDVTSCVLEHDLCTSCGRAAGHGGVV